jgi:xanthine dehydrogenase/oxidase
MSMYTLIRNNAFPSMAEVETAFQGNLCRCTGYRPILEGYKTLTSDGGCCGQRGANGGCCMQQTDSGLGSDENSEVSSTNGSESSTVSTLFDPSTFKNYDPSMEIIFPSELQVQKEPS